MLEIKQRRTRPSTPAPSTKRWRCSGLNLTSGRGRFRHRHRRQRRGQIHACSTPWRASGPWIRAASSSTAQDVTAPAGASSAPTYIGRVFQDPMMGTAATMQIEENLALAARRGKKRSLQVGHHQGRARGIPGAAEDAGPGPGGPHDRQGRPAVRRPAPGADAADGHPATSPSCCCWTSTPPPWTPRRPPRCWTLSEKIVAENHLTTLMITHNMKDAIEHGNRLIMMYEGHVIYDVRGEEKANLQVSDLLQRFEQVSDGGFANDRMLLS